MYIDVMYEEGLTTEYSICVHDTEVRRRVTALGRPDPGDIGRVKLRASVVYRTVRPGAVYALQRRS